MTQWLNDAARAAARRQNAAAYLAWEAERQASGHDEWDAAEQFTADTSLSGAEW